MITDPANFLISVARLAAARAAAQTPPVVLTWGGNLFAHRGPGGKAAHVVLRLFGGTNDATNPSARVNVQIAARSPSNAEAWRLAQAAFEAVALDDAGVQARMVRVPAYEGQEATVASGHWVLVAAETIGRPGQLGRDADDVVSVVANVSLGFYRGPEP